MLRDDTHSLPIIPLHPFLGGIEMGEAADCGGDAFLLAIELANTRPTTAAVTPS